RLNTIEKYTQPEVIEFWRRFSQQGLQKCESEMLARYAPPPARMIDLGCGAGRVGIALKDSSYAVTGLDLVWPMIRTARELYAENNIAPNLLQADIRSVPCANDHYDVALIFIAALQHISGRIARREVFAEVSRIIRSDGVLILALDNLAPALTCYGWWVWRKVRSILKPSSNGHAIDHTAADDLLESRRMNRSTLSWHARGLARTLRWRTWTGLIDRARQAHLLRGEIGDTAIDQVSLTPTRGMVYYHVYRHAELIDDAASAGLTLLGYHDGRELNEGQTFTPRVRQLDKQVLYAFRH
ncbi:MAG TPA: class I SAM-dependent methyltransferase, partial [Anaerolineae bacterium]|nr:class I SAM-dependent methyltransferase [Anaerolineae bacterium]